MSRFESIPNKKSTHFTNFKVENTNDCGHMCVIDSFISQVVMPMILLYKPDKNNEMTMRFVNIKNQRLFQHPLGYVRGYILRT